jgi:hypothetical protein
MPGKLLMTGCRAKNESRPHSSLNYQTPAEFVASWRNVKIRRFTSRYD